MNKKHFSSSIALTAIFISSAQALEPLKDSTEAYNRRNALRSFSKLDSNKDGVFRSDEDAGLWKKVKRADVNGDGALDFEEYSIIPKKYVDSPGKKLLNVRFKKTATSDVYLDFYFPDTDESTEKPVVIYTHGGGWAAGSKHGAGNASFNVVHRALLKKGFCVLSVGYRLVTKDGETSMRDCVIDSKDALRYVSAHRKELGIDPMRIYTFGDSAGGHLAQMVLLSPPDTLTGDPELADYTYQTVAGVSWYGPCDFEDAQLFNHDDRENFRDRFGPRIMGKGAKPEDKPTLYREMSPVNYLTIGSPALLLIQGDKDTTIPVKQAHRMERALKTIDAPVDILIVKNAGHNWRSVGAPIAPSRNAIIDRTVQFILDHP